MDKLNPGDTVKVLPSNGLNFRKDPDVRMPILLLLRKEDRLEVLDLPFEPLDKRFEWLYLKHSSGLKGWSAAKHNESGDEYLEKVGASVPEEVDVPEEVGVPEEVIAPEENDGLELFGIKSWPTEFIERPSTYKSPITQHQNARPNVYARFGLQKGHNGVDLYAPLEARIFAAYPGEVVKIAFSPDGYGWNVRVKHGPYTVIYAHLTDDIPVSVGGVVSPGDIIGFSGNTGWSTGPHLHIELRDDRALIPSSPYYEGEVWGVVDIEDYITEFLSQAKETDEQ